eukprot:TRINITY_DN39124_c0_g1_i4.p2 TRINITY_DN39124_c0_g1~~TRINITY_DN39124_c0_g1_i4.p2  ORF type:complete len:168 (+),score=27.70 TRINITY_DN39124_c0_g1_i4:151-654(+)
MSDMGAQEELHRAAQVQIQRLQRHLAQVGRIPLIDGKPIGVNPLRDAMREALTQLGAPSHLQQRYLSGLPKVARAPDVHQANPSRSSRPQQQDVTRLPLGLGSPERDDWLRVSGELDQKVTPSTQAKIRVAMESHLEEGSKGNNKFRWSADMRAAAEKSRRKLLSKT